MAVTPSNATVEELNEDGESINSSANQSVSTLNVPDKYGFISGRRYSPSRESISNSEIIIRREKKWIEMLNSWEYYMKYKFPKVKERCRKGIPQSLRERAWLYLCGGRGLMKQQIGVFKNLLESPAKDEHINDINKDLHRLFPDHEMFTENALGRDELFKVLKAYSILNSQVGYCQAQGVIAAFLLMHMPAEKAFWSFVAICDKYLIGYYNHNMEVLVRDGNILFALLKKVSPTAYNHLHKQNIDPVHYMTEWFSCVYVRTLPWETALRVWDIFLCEGVKVIIKVGLVLLKGCLGKKSVLKQCPTMFETLERLRNPPEVLIEEEALIKQVLKLNISDEEFLYEHERQTKKMKINATNKQSQK